MRADLHVHTIASDGTVEPAAVVAMAAELGLDALAITDHDSVEGVAPALSMAVDCSVEVVPGVELSAYDASGRDVHILGYHIDHTDADLLGMLLRLRHARLERAVKMLESLADAGYEIPVEDVLQLASSSHGHEAASGSVGRSHIARALLEAGHVESMQDAFERLIGRRQPHYVRKPLSPPDEVVAAIRSAGGLPVLAHPAVNGADVMIESLLDAGLAGIEAYHFEHSTEQTEALVSRAEEYGLIITGGSDFHGPDGRGPGLGGVLAPPDAVALLRDSAS